VLVAAFDRVWLLSAVGADRILRILELMTKPKPPHAEKTAKEQRGDPFKPGQSGNSSGRPAGSRNKATVAMEALLDGQAEALTQKAIDMALEGDITALRLCLDRVLPARKDRPVTFRLPVGPRAASLPHARALPRRHQA
jgi:hypothetical protein